MEAILHPLIRQLNLPAGNGVLYLVYVYLLYVIICLTHILEAQHNPEKYRFEVELEFVQCLANPSYLNCKHYLIT